MIAIIGIGVLGNKGGSMRYQSIVGNKERWKTAVTDEQLEQNLFFPLTDTPDKFSHEL